MQPDELEKLISKVIEELATAGLVSRLSGSGQSPLVATPGNRPLPVFQSAPPEGNRVEKKELVVAMADPTSPASRMRPGIMNPEDAEGLTALMNSTTARIGFGRAGNRLRTRSLLLFQSDLAITHDALCRDVNDDLLKEFNLFKVQSTITGGKQEYLLRPDLGRQLNEEARILIKEKCVKNPNIQLCIGDGLSASAIESNLRKIMPVIRSGCQNAKLIFGTPFFIQYCRVGIMNDIGDLIQPDVLILLIGERPGLGRADSMSAYMAYQPGSGHTDADRDVICNIYDGGGTNPLEAGAYAVQFAQKMIRNKASGVKLKLIESKTG